MGRSKAQARHDAMHKCVCSSQCNKKGGCAVRESCHGCPALHRRAGPLAPRDNHSLAEGYLSFPVSVGGACQALVASLVCAAWHNMVTYLLLAPCSFPSLSFRVMRVLSLLCSLLGCNILMSPTGGVVLPMQTGLRRRGFCRAMASCHCHPWLVSYSCGGVVCYLLMPRTCSPLSYFSPCCACYGVF